MAAVGAVAAGVALRRLGRVEVTGDSMLPTLAPGDRLLVVRLRRPRPGDVVAVRDPRDPRRTVVKRVATVGSGGYVVVGENRALSTDSRHYGPVARPAVRGRVVYRYFPEERRGRLRPPVRPAPEFRP